MKIFKPHKIVPNMSGDYLRRWHLIPRNKLLNCYLHHFIGNDDGPELHDHPWWSLSIVLRGGYWDVLPRDVMTLRKAGDFILRRPRTIHRVTLSKRRDDALKPAWSLFLTGPVVREWGFWKAGTWIKHDEHLAAILQGKVVAGTIPKDEIPPDGFT